MRWKLWLNINCLYSNSPKIACTRKRHFATLDIRVARCRRSSSDIRVVCSCAVDIKLLVYVDAIIIAQNSHRLAAFRLEQTHLEIGTNWRACSLVCENFTVVFHHLESVKCVNLSWISIKSQIFALFFIQFLCVDINKLRRHNKFSYILNFRLHPLIVSPISLNEMIDFVENVALVIGHVRCRLIVADCYARSMSFAEFTSEADVEDSRCVLAETLWKVQREMINWAKFDGLSGWKMMEMFSKFISS